MTTTEKRDDPATEAGPGATGPGAGLDATGPGAGPDATGPGAADAEAASGGEPGTGDGEADGGAAGGGAEVGDAGGAERDEGHDEDIANGDGADAPAVSRVRAWWRLVRRQPKRRVAACAVLALLLLATGGLRWEQARLADPAAGRNQALTDTATTDQVIGDVSNALGRIFAYTPDDTQSTADAARDVLAGTAAAQYQALFARITQQVAAQHLTLTTRVVRAGVVTLADGRARLLVFLDQTAQRAGATATTAAAQLSVTAELRGGRWRITSLTAR